MRKTTSFLSLSSPPHHVGSVTDLRYHHPLYPVELDHPKPTEPLPDNAPLIANMSPPATVTPKVPIFPPIHIHIRRPDDVTSKVVDFVLSTTHTADISSFACWDIKQLLCAPPRTSSRVTNDIRNMCMEWSETLDKNRDCTIPALLHINNMLVHLSDHGEYRACEYILSIVSDYKRCSKKLRLFVQSLLKKPEYERAIVCAYAGQDIDYVLRQHVTFEDEHQRAAVLARYNIHL